MRELPSRLSNTERDPDGPRGQMRERTVSCTDVSVTSRSRRSLERPYPVLWNRNYFYGSGSDIWKFIVPVPVPTFEKVMVPIPVPTFEKLRFRFQLHIYTMKNKFFLKNLFPLHSKLFYKEKDYKYQQIYCKIWKKKMLNEGNQIHNFISSSGSGTVINYGSGSDFLTSYGSGSGSTTLALPGPLGDYTQSEQVIFSVPEPGVDKGSQWVWYQSCVKSHL